MEEVMNVNTVECRHCGTRTTADLLESHIAERCPRHPPTRKRDDVAALRSSGVSPTVTAMHHRQRNDGVPRPYSDALEMRAAAAGTPPAPKVLRDADGTPMPWSSALAARREAR
jgi:hypothetical protein